MWTRAMLPAQRNQTEHPQWILFQTMGVPSIFFTSMEISCFLTNCILLSLEHSCMTDSQRAGSGSHFVARGARELRFSVDSFLLKTVPQVSMVPFVAQSIITC